MKNSHRLIIIGSGPAGLTAAIYTARAHLNPLLIEGKEPGGQLMGTSIVENWPGVTSIQGPALMNNMKEHAQHAGCTFISGNVTALDLSQHPFKISVEQKVYTTTALILAMGATPKRLGCPGENEYWGKGVTTCAVCDGALYQDLPVVIVGGGDTAMENASFMVRFTKKITIIHLHDAFTASATMQKRVLSNPDIKVIYNSTVTDVIGNGTHVTGVTITNQQTGAKTVLETSALFVAIGLAPNTTLLRGQIELNAHGYVVLKERTQTSVEGVFAAGDIADERYRQAIVSSGSGCQAALDAERYLASLDDKKLK